MSLMSLFSVILSCALCSSHHLAVANAFAFPGQLSLRTGKALTWCQPSALGTSPSRYGHGYHRPRLASSSADATANKASREEQLDRLAQTLNVGVPKVKELLAKQRGRLDGSEEKARHIDWLLGNEPPASSGSSPAQRPPTPKKKKSAKQQQQPIAPKKVTNPNALGINEAPAAEKRRKSTRVRPARPAAVERRAEERRAAAKKRQDEALKDPSLLSDVEFASRTDIHHSSKRALTEVMGFSSMTEIQAGTYAAALSGRDVLGRARTGTGKTLAFLLPAIERVLRSGDYAAGRDVGVLVVSNTRELAMQIGDEAEKLLTYHPDMSVHVAYGGTKKSRDENQLRRGMPTVLVATPGRLLDLLESARIGGGRFSDIMSTTPVLVLDETDRLLDMGFRREINKILTYLPRSNKRQTLLFSATIPDELRSIMAKTMKDDFIEVDCIGEGTETAHTNVRVEQSHVIIPSMDLYIASVVDIIQEAVKDGEGRNKVVVFFPAARLVSFFADVFNEVVGTPVMELHSKKTQSYRNRVSGKFRSASNGILFTSDVSARGVDYPDVTHVLQVGLPESREQYIHRLGRTGRAGSAGKGWLILGPFESQFLGELKGIDVPKDSRLADVLEGPTSKETEDVANAIASRVRGGDKQLTESGERAYQAFLGYYLSQMKRMRIRKKEDLVGIANEISSLMGFREAPAFTKRMVGKMGLKGVGGVVIKEQSEEHHGRHEHANGRRAANDRRKRKRSP